MNNILKNKSGSAIIIIVFLALMGFFGVTLMASDIIKSNLIMGKTQLNSTQAYFAAEVGLEQALWGVMQGDYELPAISEADVFSDASMPAVDAFLDQSTYKVKYNRADSIRTFVSEGGYLTEHRSTEVSFCIPDCEGKACGVDDGCDNGIVCPSYCESEVGCQPGLLPFSNKIDGSDGACCGTEICLECAESYIWNGTVCEYDCIQQCGGLMCGEIDPNCGLPCPASCKTNPGCQLTTSPPLPNAIASGASCCDVGLNAYTCYECDEGSSWNGSACFTCVANEGFPYPTSTECYDAGVYDCFGTQAIALEQPAKGESCSGGDEAIVSLGMNEGSGLTVFDSTSNGNDGFFEGSQWTYRKEILIDHNKFQEDLINFPFLLDIQDNELFWHAQDDGDDIMFRDKDGVKIPHEIEFFEGSIVGANQGRFIAWLKIPRLYAAQDTKIYMYYGNASIGNQQEKVQVWTGNKAVWHLGYGTSAWDSSGNLMNGTYVTNGVLPNAVPGQIAFAQESPGTLASYGYANIPNLSPGTNDITVSAWVKTTSTDPEYILNVWASTGGSGVQFYLENGLLTFRYSWLGVDHGVASVADGDWHHIAIVVKDGPPCIFYIDGEIDYIGGNCVVTYPTTANLRSILGYNIWNAFSGQIDDLRLSYEPFTQNYIKNSYLNQLDPTSYVTVGSQEGPLAPVASWVPSLYGKALYFDGESNFLSFPGTESILPSNALTLEAWVYVDSSLSDYDAIASKWGNAWSWGLYKSSLNGTITPCVYIKRLFGSERSCGNMTIPTGQWSHVALTLSRALNFYKFYLNGVPDAGGLIWFPDYGNVGSLEVGSKGGADFFKGTIDEFQAFDYIRTQEQIEFDASKSVCDGGGNCEPLSAPLLNTITHLTCNDICYLDGKQCSSVGTDSLGYNGLMSVYNDGYCGTLLADCSTSIMKNPNDSSLFSCFGHQTDWTNCNCSICDSDYNLPCPNSACIVSGTGIMTCDGECINPDYIPNGTVCGTNMECDGIGNCRSVCHPLYGQACGADQCNNPGIWDCDGYCVDKFPKTDGIVCENLINDPREDECWAGLCVECVANLGATCNVGDCLDAGIVDCFGGCSACVDGDCFTNPNYADEGVSCDSGSGPGTGTCDNSGNCDACHADVVNFGFDCNTETCHVPGTRDCVTGVCSTGSTIDTDAFCLDGDDNSGICLGTGVCYACETGYKDICNNSTPCHQDGEIMCDGVTCSESGYKDTNDFCDAGYLTSTYYPNTGYCTAAHVCNDCNSFYLNGDECNTGACEVSGFYECDGGCSACVGGDCDVNPNNLSMGSQCDTGAVSDQPYTGLCTASGVCDPCVSGFINMDACNTGECLVEGVYDCAGTCSTLGQITGIDLPCNAGIYDGYPGRITGTCDVGGTCITCDLEFIFNLDCWPEVGSEICYNYGKVIECQGDCVNWSYRDSAQTCNTGAVTIHPYSGTCDGAGACEECADDFLNDLDCNTEECHIVGKVDCEGTCLTEGDFDPVNTECDAGIVGSTRPYTGTCDLVGDCQACSDDYLYLNPCVPATGDAVCYNPGLVNTCQGACEDWSYVQAGTPCGGSDECDGAGNCTAPLAVIVVMNSITEKSCDELCESAPFVSRGCLGVGYDIDGTNFAMATKEGTCVSAPTSCDSAMTDTESNCELTPGDSHAADWTRCRCGNCVGAVGTVCIAADECNNEVTEQCDASCPANYIDNDTYCDPGGASLDGYCWWGVCEQCDATVGTACNVGECRNEGAYDCHSACSASGDLYKPVGTICTGGACNSTGTCVPCNLILLDTPCPIVAPKDSECYDPGVYDCNENCVSIQNINNNAVCHVDVGGAEGRCVSGDCVPCNMTYYGLPCPAVAPYDSFCRYFGTYGCFGAPPACEGVYNLNQGLSGCGGPSYLCDFGECVSIPDEFIIENVASGRSCTSMCDDYENRLCINIGTDAGGTNGIVSASVYNKDCECDVCDTITGTCGSTMSPRGLSCTGANGYTHEANWTNCFCTTCDDRLYEDCSDNAMWDAAIYDEECYSFGLYDCDGNCYSYGITSGTEGNLCTVNSSLLGGNCALGECIQCHDDYLNSVPCPASDCGTATRLCDGTCSIEMALTIGESCGVDMECDIEGTCVLASTLPDIVIPNFANNRSCNSVCGDYTDRYCESVGTDGGQTGGINGNMSRFGLDDEVPTCYTLPGACSAVVDRSPKIVTDANYGFTCDGNLTDWNYCRCSNE